MAAAAPAPCWLARNAPETASVCVRGGLPHAAGLFEDLTEDRSGLGAGDAVLAVDDEEGHIPDADLVGPGVSLGVAEDLEYETRHVVLTAGQIVVVGTDGIWEMRSPGGEMYGRDRFRDAIRRHAQKDAQGIVDAVFEELSTFRGDAPQEDDVTLLVVKDVAKTGEETPVRKPGAEDSEP